MPTPSAYSSSAISQAWRRLRVLSLDTNILKLPRIVAIEIFRKQTLPVFERSPIAIDSDNVAEIGPSNGEDTLVIHLIRFDDPRARMLDRPNDPAQHCRGDLERSGIVVR